MSEFKPFTDLEVWKKARNFKIEIEREVKSFPAEEKFRLADQIIRSVRSINANISEGHGRYGYPDQIRFCMQARGSLNETYNHLIDAYDSQYINKEKLHYYKEKFDEIARLLNGYITYLRKLNNTN
jgi:four helix bundle protein